MSVAEATAPASVLNFILVGDVRSGTGVVQSAISNRPGVVCHGDLFHPDEAVRRAAHQDYFGQPADPEGLPEWFVPAEVSPWHYLSRKVFACPLRGETAVGVRLVYPVVAGLELFTLMRDKYLEGDFCVIHVRRNPVVCFVSLQQAERSGVWRLGLEDDQAYRPSPVSIDESELTAFCRAHLAMERKVRDACPDALEISYRDLHVDLQPTMRRVWDFLELDETYDDPARPSCKRLRNRVVRDRVCNWDAIRKVVPSDVRQLMDGDDVL